MTDWDECDFGDFSTWNENGLEPSQEAVDYLQESGYQFYFKPMNTKFPRKGSHLALVSFEKMQEYAETVLDPDYAQELSELTNLTPQELAQHYSDDKNWRQINLEDLQKWFEAEKRAK